MENNYSNAETRNADARASTGNSSESLWSDTRDPAQTRQISQSGDDDGESMRRAGEDADDFGRKAANAANAAEGYLQDAKTRAADAAQKGKAYAQEAVNAAGKKIDGMKDQAASLKQRGIQFAADEPLKAVAYATAGGAVLTALLLSFMRGSR